MITQYHPCSRSIASSTTPLSKRPTTSLRIDGRSRTVAVSTLTRTDGLADACPAADEGAPITTAIASAAADKTVIFGMKESPRHCFRHGEPPASPSARAPRAPRAQRYADL